MKISKPQLSALEINYLVKELQFLIGSKVDKIFHPEKRQLILQLHKTGIGKNLLKIQVPEYFCITQNKQATERPSQFCIYLRKKFSNSFLESIEQKGFERIIELKFKTKEKPISLILEFFSTGNIIIVEEGKITSALEYQILKSRKVQTREEYKYPMKEYDFLNLIEKDIERLLQETHRSSVVKALAVDLGLGGVFAEEACFNAKVDKDEKPKDVKKLNELFDALLELLKKKVTPMKIDDEIIPFELNSRKGEKIGLKTLNEAIDGFTKVEISKEQQLFDKSYLEKLKKVENIIRSQEATVKKLSKKEQESKDKGDLIYANFQTVKEILDLLKGGELKEIIQKLKQEKKIKDFNLKEKTITVDV